MANVPQVSDDVLAFLEEKHAHDSGAKLIFAIDATASREWAWDTACHLQAEMFAEAAKIGGLMVQLVYYRGPDECRASRWTENARELTNLMVRIHCRAGHTQIAKILKHVAQENKIEKVNAAVFIGDACEEVPRDLYAAAERLSGVPLFVFQEGDDDEVAMVFRQLARISGGAHCQFAQGAVEQLRQLLRAIAAFAAGGHKALSDLRTDAARKLLAQIK